MLHRSQVEPFLFESGGRLQVRFLEDTPGAPVAALLDRLARLVARLDGRPEGMVREALRRQDRRVRDHRRLAGIAKSLLDLCEFRPPAGAGLAPEIREAVFRARGRLWPPVPGDRERPFLEAAAGLGLAPEEAAALLYADRTDRRILIRVPRISGGELLARYNLELARAALYDARRVTIHAQGGWRDLHRAVKRSRLMFVLARSGSGYSVDVTGPAASFVSKPQRYGIRLARVVPAVVRAPGWRLVAEVRRETKVRRGPEVREHASGSAGAATGGSVMAGERWVPLELDASIPALMTVPRVGRFDSRWERDLDEEFAEKFGGGRSGWRLERETTPVDLGGEWLLPDFTLRHADGREALVEIVGFWTPEYLSAKLERVRRAALPNLILVVYEALAAAEPLSRAVPGPVLTFKAKPRAGEVVELAERVGVVPSPAQLGSGSRGDAASAASSDRDRPSVGLTWST